MLLKSYAIFKHFSTYASIWTRKSYNVHLDMQKYPQGYRNPQKLHQLQTQFLNTYLQPQLYADRLIQLAKQLNRQGYYQSVLQLGQQDQLLDGQQKRELLEQQQYALSKIPVQDSILYPLKTPYNPSQSFLIFGLKLFIGYSLFSYLFDRSVKFIQQATEDKDGSSTSQFNKPAEEIKPEKNIKTRFTDVIGVDEFKEELMELTDYLKNPEKYRQAGGRLPKGILLVGPPGTGKTLMARALAGEANCNFFYKSGAEFDEIYVGEGAARVRALFKQARQDAPSIIFIDEIDSLTGKRGTQGTFVNNAGRDTISQVLTAMDGFKPTQNIIVIGATNLQQSIDPAIKRAGRFDKILHVPIPDIEGRKQLFSFYLKKTSQQQGLDINALAKRTTGFTGADIQNMVNLAIMNAVKNCTTFYYLERTQTVKTDYEYAYDRILMGVGRTKMVVPPETKKLTAYRQAGQAVTSLMTPGATPLHKITILPRGKDMGFTSSVPDKDVLNHTKKSMQAQIDVLLGGRVAQQLFSGQNSVTSTSAQSLAKATKLAYTYMTTGMDENFSLIYADSKFEVSEQLKYDIDLQVQRMLGESYTRVKYLLLKNKSKVNVLVNKLIQKQTLTAQDVKKLLRMR